MKNGKKRWAVLLTAFLALTVWMGCFAFSAPAHASATVTVNGEETLEIPDPVINPALIGQWGWHSNTTEAEMFFRFEADGTGLYAANGIEMPIASYVATQEPYTQYPEDGFLLTVYFGEMTMTFGDESFTITMSPMEYGYSVTGDTLRITFSRDIANDYTDLTREPVSK